MSWSAPEGDSVTADFPRRLHEHGAHKQRKAKKRPGLFLQVIARPESCEADTEINGQMKTQPIEGAS
jgi:predicted GIY-YIG superfamily endonuclease